MTDTEDGSARTAPEARGPWRRLELWHVLLVLLATTAHWLPRLSGPLDLRYDGGVYYILGTSLAQGDGYRLLSEPGEIQGIQYPPLLPGLIALHQLALGSDDPLVVGRALRVSAFVLSLAYAVGAYALARRWLGPWPGLLAGLLTTLYFHTLFLEDLCFSEIPFAATTVAFFLCAGSRNARLRAGSPLLAAAAFFLRTAGVALLAGWTLSALVRREWRSFLLRALCSAACVLAWQGYVRSVVTGEEYAHPAYEYQRAPYQYYNVSYTENVALLDPFAPEKGRVTPGVLAVRGVTNLPKILVGMGESVSAAHGFWEWPLRYLARKLGRWVPLSPVRVPLGAIGVVVLLGFWQLLRRGALELVLYVACASGLIALLPWPGQITRYLAPLVPFLALAFAAAVTAAGRHHPRRAVGAAGLFVLLQAGAAWWAFEHYHYALRYPEAPGREAPGSLFLFDDPVEWRSLYASLGWLRDNTEPDALVATSCPHLVWLHAGRKAVLPPFEADPAQELRLLDAVPVDYAVVDDLRFLDVTRRYAEPALASRPDLWEVVHQDPAGGLTIYRRRR